MYNGISAGIVLIVIFLVLGFVLTLFISFFLTPMLKTPKKILGEILDLIDLKEEDVVIDLGSGDGDFLLEAYGRSKCKCFGYDISPIMLILANTKRHVLYPFTKDVSFSAENIFDIDFSKATKIYCYLDEKSMKILKPKLENFVKDGSMVVSYRYEVPGLKSKKVELSNGKELFIYVGK